MVTADDVAAAVIERLRGDADPNHWFIDTYKLQKLVYYCQAWHLVWEGEPLFDEPIQAWAGGPVVYSLYRRHSGQFSVRDWPYGNSSELTKAQRNTVESVVDAYGRLSGRQLSLLTHRERPWREARGTLGPGERGNSEIRPDVMVDYYSGLEENPDTTPIEELEPESAE